MSTVPNGWPFSSWLDIDTIRVAEQKGEAPPIADLLTDSLNFMEQFLHETNAFRRPPGFSRIIAGFTATWWMGARTRYTIPPSGYAISIDAGTWIQLYMAFDRLLAHPDVLPAQTTVPFPPFDQRLGLPSVGIGSDGELMLCEGVRQIPNRPADSKRDLCLLQLLSFAIRFLFSHELAHVRLGHIEFRINQAKEYDHLRRQEREQLLDSKFRAVEFLADAHAAIESVQIVNWGSAIQEDRQTIKDRHRSMTLEQLRLWGFATGVVYLVTERIDYLQGESYQHPSAVERKMFARASPAGSPVDFVGLSRDSVLDAINDGIDDAEKAWDTMGWTRSLILPDDFRDTIIAVLDLQEHIIIPSDMWLPQHTEDI